MRGPKGLSIDVPAPRPKGVKHLTRRSDNEKKEHPHKERNVDVRETLRKKKVYPQSYIEVEKEVDQIPTQGKKERIIII
jgi:hypothetical protein